MSTSKELCKDFDSFTRGAESLATAGGGTGGVTTFGAVGATYEDPVNFL